MDIRISSTDDFFAHVDSARLLAEYAAECRNPELPPPNPDPVMYRALQVAGLLHVLTVHEGDEMIGFACVVVSVNPHYNVPLANTESLFVAAGHRGGYVGVKLLDAVKDLAREKGAHGLYVVAPIGTRLPGVLYCRGYRETNSVHFTKLDGVNEFARPKVHTYAGRDDDVRGVEA